MSENNATETRMQLIRRNALDAFNSLEMPNLRYGLGIYVDLALVNLDEVLKENNVFDRIKIEADLRVKIINFPSMDKEFLEKYFDKLAKADENKILALHYSVLNDAVALVIPKNTNIEKPIIIYSNFSSKSKAESIIVIAEEASKASIIEVSESGINSNYKSQIVQVYAGENSELNYYSLQNLNDKVYNFSTKRGEVKQDAKINWIDLLLGSKFTQLKLKTNLLERGASTKKLGAFFGNNNQQFDINVESVHSKGNTQSSMNHRGVLNDSAKSIFRGTVNIAKNSASSVGHQRADILLMGENAKCDAVPILDVENDEVICSHGVTVGQLDPEQIFYLLSRGLDESLAKQMLIAGFLDPIARDINHEEIRNKFSNIINEKLKSEKLIEVQNVNN